MHKISKEKGTLWPYSVDGTLAQCNYCLYTCRARLQASQPLEWHLKRIHQITEDTANVSSQPESKQNLIFFFMFSHSLSFNLFQSLSIIRILLQFLTSLILISYYHSFSHFFSIILNLS